MTKYTRWLPRLIGPAILGYFLLTTDINRIVLNLRNLRWAPFLLSLALYPIFVALKAWRWNRLLHDLGMQAPHLGSSMILYMIGLFLGGATPGQSGDFIKAWYLRDRGQPLASALFSVLLDRLFDFLIMALLSLLGLIAFIHLFPRQARGPIEVMTIGSAAAIALMIPALMARGPRDWLMIGTIRLAPGRARARLERWRTQFAALDLRPGLVGSLLFATVCAAASTMIRLWLLFRALDVTIPVGAMVSSMALVSNLQTLPISFSGVGVRDAVLIPVLATYGYGADKALALSALVLFLSIENIVLGFLTSLRYPLGRAAPADPAGTEIVGR
jgi:uncharacterized membrane protein YbhN (UPF0104 family)